MKPSSPSPARNNDRISRFVADLSHEVRSPLNAIVGFSELLDDEVFGVLNDDQHEAIRDILSAARYLVQLLGDVLDIHKIELGKIELEYERLSVVGVLGQVLTVARALAHEKNLQLHMQVPADLAVWADERRFSQIVYNLLSNAAKFSKDEGNVWVQAHQDGEFISISVRDEGCGIAPADHERVFEDFTALRREEHPSSTGLGLSVTRRLVELMGGRITVESQPNEGATFTFTLPAEAPSLTQ